MRVVAARWWSGVTCGFKWCSGVVVSFGGGDENVEECLVHGEGFETRLVLMERVTS